MILATSVTARGYQGDSAGRMLGALLALARVVAGDSVSVVVTPPAFSNFSVKMGRGANAVDFLRVPFDTRPDLLLGICLDLVIHQEGRRERK